MEIKCMPNQLHNASGTICNKKGEKSGTREKCNLREFLEGVGTINDWQEYSLCTARNERWIGTTIQCDTSPFLASKSHFFITFWFTRVSLILCTY